MNKREAKDMSTLSGLLKGKYRYIMFGGKGGVGKTTCAAAAALYMASHGKKTLVFSTDPAHSLSDSFRAEIGNKITPVDGVDNLHALEISAEEVFEDFKTKYRSEIEEVFDQLLGAAMDMPFERKIMEDMMELSPPGLDELMALRELTEITKNLDYDLVVIDTAPGGHTIRLLQLPEILEEWFNKALTLFEQYRYVAPLPKTRQLIEDMRDDIYSLKATFMDSGLTEFVFVTIPEAMGILVTETMLEHLESPKVHSGNIIVNFVTPPHLKCDYCASRRAWQVKRVEEIRERFPQFNVTETPLYPQQVHGVESLTDFSKILFEPGYKSRFPGVKAGVSKEPIPDIPETNRLQLPEDLEFILFGGKGGVGKTTCAIASAIHMAKSGRETLVISTDPQHSLPDSFDQEIGREVTPIRGVDNLYALEIDAEKLMERWLDEHREEILEIASSATIFEKEDVKDFFDQSIGPGMDEFMALLKIANMIRGGGYDVYVFDTAPTGHTIRLLQLPDLMAEWVDFMQTVRSKSQYIAQTFFGSRLREKADVFLENLLRDVKTVKAALTSRRRTRFVAVTILEEMATLESERLVKALNELKVPIEQIIVNGLVPPNPGCDWCMSRARMQRRELQGVRKRFPGLEVIGMPLFPHEVRGVDTLTEYGEILFGSVKPAASGT
ncbi:MAG: ArsA family ATPase [Candidatus Bathyarchaeia archaeon]